MKNNFKIIIFFLSIFIIASSCKTETRIISLDGIYINDEVSQQHKESGNYIELKMKDGIPVSGQSFAVNTLKAKIYFNEDGLLEKMQTEDEEFSETKITFSYKNKKIISMKVFDNKEDKPQTSIDYIYQNNLLNQMIFISNDKISKREFEYEETVLTITHHIKDSKGTFVEKIHFEKDNDQRKRIYYDLSFAIIYLPFYNKGLKSFKTESYFNGKLIKENADKVKRDFYFPEYKVLEESLNQHELQ